MISFQRLFQNKLFFFLFFFLVALMFLLPIFKNLNNWGVWDWDYDIFVHAVPRLTILQHHQFPLWNPYYCGGAPLLANPQSKFLSPFFLFILIAGEVIGTKIVIFLHLIIGLLGIYQLARHFQLAKFSSVFSSFIYMLSTQFSLPIATGMTTFMFMAYLPWIFLYYLKSFIKLKNILIAVFFLLLMFFGGGIQLFLITLVFLAIYSSLIIVFNKHSFVKTVKILALMFLLTFSLGAIKFLPAIEFIKQYSRQIENYSGYSLNSLQYSLFNRNQSITAEDKFPPRAYGFINGISAGMNENGAYIGIISGLLFLLGFIFCFKRQLPLAFLLVIFLWLSFGNRIPFRFFRIWGFLRKFPLFSSMREAERFHFIFILGIAIFAGLGLTKLNNFLQKRIKSRFFSNFIIVFIIIFVATDLIVVSRISFNEAFPIFPISLPRSSEFYQIWRNPKYDKKGMTSFESSWYRSRSSLYPTFLANIGTICGYEPIPVPRNAIPKEDNRYRGEVFLQDAKGEATIAKWSPNRVIINLNILNYGYLVLNQNYYSGWRVKAGTKKSPEPINQLLGVKVNPFDEKIEFYYLPTSFIIGLIISLGTLCLIIVVLIPGRLKNKVLKLIK